MNRAMTFLDKHRGSEFKDLARATILPLCSCVRVFSHQNPTLVSDYSTRMSKSADVILTVFVQENRHRSWNRIMMIHRWLKLRRYWAISGEERIVLRGATSYTFILRMNTHPHNWLVVSTADHRGLNNLWMEWGRLARLWAHTICMWVLSGLNSINCAWRLEALKHSAAEDLRSWLVLSLLIYLLLVSFQLAYSVLDLVHQVDWKFLNVTY